MMKPQRILMIVAIIVFCLAFCFFYFTRAATKLENSAEDSYLKKQKNICGQYCLISILQHHGKNVDIDEILSSAPPRHGTNLAQLKALAEAYGLKTLGAKMPAAVLFAMRLPAVLHVNGAHFVALLPNKTGNDFTVIDPPRSFTVAVPKDLTSRWNWEGNCLFIDDKEIILPGMENPTGVPKIAVDNPVYDAGIVFEDTIIISPTFNITNKGTADLIIKEVKTDCSCTTADIEQKKLEPGESIPLTVKFHVEGRFGKMAERKTVVITNDPETPKKILTIKAQRTREFALDPPRASMGLLKLGTEKIILMRVIPGSENRKIFPDKALFASPFVGLSNVQDNFANLNPDHYLLKIRLSPNTPPGPFNEKIRVPCAGASRDMLEIPVTAEIVGPIRLSLTEVQFGLIDRNSKAVTRDVHLQSDEPFDIIGLTATQTWLEAENQRVSTTKSTLKISINPPEATQGKLEGLVNIETNVPDMNEVSIPVYAFKL